MRVPVCGSCAGPTGKVGDVLLCWPEQFALNEGAKSGEAQAERGAARRA
jgi:hypothetical protein